MAQSYPNTEIVLTDDCSTDDSLAVAAQYARRVEITRNSDNLGQPKNTNRCVAASHGEYLVILHSDDALLPDFCDRLVPILQQHAVGMAVGERLETDELNEVREITPFYECDCIVPGEKQAKVFMMAASVPCQVLVRRKVFNDAGAVHEKHVVNLDGLLWFKCALQGDVAYTRSPVCIYRRHSNNTTAAYNRTINHMMEYYATLSEMFRAAQDRPYLQSHFAEAERRVGALTVRYCHGVIEEGNYELAKRFLALATVFDPDIVQSEDYRTLKYCIESQVSEPIELYHKLVPAQSHVRKHSYEPPAGFQLLTL
jgi:glycosyltransferase involved in cell wall biosynthesis